MKIENKQPLQKHQIITLIYFSKNFAPFFQFEYPGTREYLEKNTRKFEYLEIEYFGITSHQNVHIYL